MSIVPIVDLAAFFNESDEAAKQKAAETLKHACEEYGMFKIINHGVPVEVMERAVKLSVEFFNLPAEEKLKSSPISDDPLPAGYKTQPSHSPDENEYLLMYSPRTGLNVMPAQPPNFRETLEEMFTYIQNSANVLQNILNRCLGLPEDCLRRYNGDGTCDFMNIWHYFPATDTANNGLLEHTDGNLFTFVVQDDVGGLEFKKDGKWLRVEPTPGAIVVNVGDTIQVLSNDKFKSAIHRVVGSKEKFRHSFAFFYNTEGEQWIEPLTEFSKEMGEVPKFRKFQFQEYQYIRMRYKTHPPVDREKDKPIDIYYYGIAN